MKRPLLWALLPAGALLALWLVIGHPGQDTAPRTSRSATPAPTPTPASPSPSPSAARPASGAKAALRRPVPQRLVRLAPLVAARARMTAPGVDRRQALAAYRKELDRQLAAARADAAGVKAALADAEPAVRMQAIVLLTELGGEPSARALAAALEREQVTGLQLALLHGLGRLGGPAAREALVASYRRMAGQSHRYHVVRALGDLADARTLPVLGEALTDTADPSLRAHAVRALARIGGDRARRLLERARDAEPHAAVSAAIRRALARMNG